MLKGKLKLISLMVATALITGCGGQDGQDGKDGQDGNIDEVSITAVDGYIVGATVTDANGNLAFRNGDGTYSFVKAPRYPLTASGGKLLDTNEAFTGTMYTASGTVVSPITTLVTELDANGNPTDKIDENLSGKLASLYGMSATELMTDYVSKNNLEVAKLAQITHVMNQDADLLKEFKTELKIATTTNGYETVKEVATDALTKLETLGLISEVQKTVYNEIITDIDSITDVKTMETTLHDTKVMLSNMKALETLSSEIGVDPDDLKLATELVTIAGQPNATQELNATQLSTLGVDSIITENPTLVTMMNDIIKSDKIPTGTIDSKAEVTTYANHLKNLYILDINQSVSSDKTTDLKTAVEKLTGETIKEYQAYELDDIIDSDQDITSYTSLVEKVKNLKVYNKPTLSVSVVADLKEVVDGNGTAVGTKVATANATFDDANKTTLDLFSIDTTVGDGTFFDINAITGEITTKVDFDYETKTSYTITVEVTSKLNGVTANDGSAVTVATASKIITIDVVDVGDFGIQKIVYNNNNTNDTAADDSLIITFNSSVEASTLAVDKFNTGGTGSFSASATGSYNPVLKTYTITGFDTAMVVSVDGNESNITMENTVYEEGKTQAPLKITAGLDTMVFKNKEYGLVKDSDGNVWLDRNLGASQVAASVGDATAYGDLYQWGRDADGHEKRDAATTVTLVPSGATRANNGGKFIITSTSHWLSDSNTTLWTSSGDGANEVCPSGYHVPTETELSDYKTLYSISNIDDGYSKGVLKLTYTSQRYNTTGAINNPKYGSYWVSSMVGSNFRSLDLTTSAGFNYRASAAFGFAVRCKAN